VDLPGFRKIANDKRLRVYTGWKIEPVIFIAEQRCFTPVMRWYDRAVVPNRKCEIAAK
jgi:hypothetical protein